MAFANLIYILLRREPKYISVLLILLVSALLLCNPSYIVLKAVRLSETYSPTYPAAYSAAYEENMVSKLT